jgi:hypothetical protein
VTASPVAGAARSNTKPRGARARSGAAAGLARCGGRANNRHSLHHGGRFCGRIPQRQQRLVQRLDVAVPALSVRRGSEPLAQSFSFVGQPFFSPSPGEPNTRIIFAEGSTNILANVNAVTYSAGTSCTSIVGLEKRQDLPCSGPRPPGLETLPWSRKLPERHGRFSVFKDSVRRV